MDLRQYAHFGPGLVAVGLAIFGVGALAGNLAGGPFADRQGAQTVVTASLVALAIVLIVLGTLPRLTWCCWLALAFFLQRISIRLRPSEAPGGAIRLPVRSASAWNNTAMYLGILVGSAVGGRILASAGFSTLTAAAAAVALVAAFSTRRAIAAPSHQL